jgi:hypothetical protein
MATELESAFTNALGPDRLKEYRLMDQWEYRNLLDAGISTDTVLQISGMKSQVENAARDIRQNSSLTADQRNAALQSVRTETEKTLADLLGDRRARAFENNGGFWVRNLAPKN